MRRFLCECLQAAKSITDVGPYEHETWNAIASLGNPSWPSKTVPTMLEFRWSWERERNRQRQKLGDEEMEAAHCKSRVRNGLLWLCTSFGQVVEHIFSPFRQVEVLARPGLLMHTSSPESCATLVFLARGIPKWMRCFRKLLYKQTVVKTISLTSPGRIPT